VLTSRPELFNHRVLRASIPIHHPRGQLFVLSRDFLSSSDLGDIQLPLHRCDVSSVPPNPLRYRVIRLRSPHIVKESTNNISQTRRTIPWRVGNKPDKETSFFETPLLYILREAESKVEYEPYESARSSLDYTEAGKSTIIFRDPITDLAFQSGRPNGKTADRPYNIHMRTGGENYF
jgi:hypothetical protein